MTIKFLTIFIFIFGGVKHQTINESFITRIATDSAWILKFDKNGNYEYYIWNGLGSTKTLSKGNYQLNEGLLSIQKTRKDSIFKDEIPAKLYYSKLSKKEFENIEEEIYAHKEERFLFKKQYLVLSKSKLLIN